MKKQVLFLQLPLLDNDTAALRENFPFAGVWLSHALSQHSEGEFWEVVPAPAEWDELDNAHLIEAIRASGLETVAFTLCLWNVERGMRLAAQLKKVAPQMVLMAGGPEVSTDHPFLLESQFDALVIGEGEAVFSEMLKGIRTGNMPCFDKVLTAGSKGWKRGRCSPEQVDLAAVQVPVERFYECIKSRPAVYVETARGCPLTCTYCRYHHLQQGVRVLPAEIVARRIEQLHSAGAREIRFVDPTFNSRADFTRLLERLVEVNPKRELMFFAELRADTLTPEQAQRIADANFADIEVGVQSTDSNVLRAIRRPANIAQVERGIRLLADAGVKVTLDLMYGLPEQTMDDVLRSIEWARGLGPNIQIQCMQTLLLPGTDLRGQAEKYGMQAMALPPYGVMSTSTLSRKEMMQIEVLLNDSPDLPADPVTPRFTGHRLAGLFKEQCEVNDGVLRGRQNRRALVFRGENLSVRQKEICRMIEQAVSDEPDMLWQFVLCPEQEEPPELLRAMIDTLQKQPPHLLDRYASAALFGLIASRRILIRLKKGREYDAEWRAQMEELLGDCFT